MGNRAIIGQLWNAKMSRVQGCVEEQMPKLVQAISDIPDFRLTLHWQVSAAALSETVFLQYYGCETTCDVSVVFAARFIEQYPDHKTNGCFHS